MEEELEPAVAAPEVAPAPLVSCVIVCYHRPEGLAAMLGALEHPQVEVVVVNAEVDPEVEAATVAAGAVHVPLEGDPGWATGSNLGAAVAQAEHVVLLNDDLEISAASVLALREALVAGLADVVVPSIRTADGGYEPTIRALPTPRALVRELVLLPDHPLPVLRRVLRPQKWRRPAAPEPVEACGAPVLATSATVLEAQPLPEDYFMYWDEIEWFWRLREQGRSVAYLPGVTARHMGGRAVVSPWKARLVTRNGVRCVRRTQGREAARRAWLAMAAYGVRLYLVALLRSARQGRVVPELAAFRAGLGALREARAEVTAPLPTPAPAPADVEARAA